MRKMRQLAGLLLLACVLTGCGSSTFETKENAIYVKDEGEIIEANVEDFSKKYYDEKELKQFVEDSIDAYTKEHGKDAVSLTELTVEKKVATMFLQYENGDAFKGFHGEDFFAGTMADALAKGYSLDGRFFKVKGKKIGEEEAVDALEDGLKVVIMKERMGIQVDGKICYVSDNVTVVNDHTVSPVRDENNEVIPHYGEEYITVIYK